MKRDLQFTGKGKLAEALGCQAQRLMEIDRQVGDLIDDGKSTQDVIEFMNERGDLSDAEWASFLFALGYYQGWNHIQ